MITIRRADEEDWEDIEAADRECFPEDDPPDMPSTVWWVAEDEHGELAGYAAARVGLSGDSHAYLYRVGVMPAFRGHRLQRRLIRTRERWARSQGLRYVVTDTRHNPASANSLIACGYRMFEPDPPWAAFDACYWKKDLQHGKKA